MAIKKISKLSNEMETVLQGAVIELGEGMADNSRKLSKLRKYHLYTNLLLLAFLLIYIVDTGRHERYINALIAALNTLVAPFTYLYSLYDSATNGEKLAFWAVIISVIASYLLYRYLPQRK
jgi:hypothetical protein